MATVYPEFTHDYKTIVKFDIAKCDFMCIGYWLDSNSVGRVDISFSEDDKIAYIAFEDPDDALFFKVKFSI